MISFSEKLRILIDEREITQKSMANDLEIPVSTLGGYVQGTSEPDFDTLKTLALYFNVSADYLLGIPNHQTRNDRETELLRIFRALSPEQQELYLGQGKVFIQFNAKEAQKSSKSISSKNDKAV